MGKFRKLFLFVAVSNPGPACFVDGVDIFA